MTPPVPHARVLAAAPIPVPRALARGWRLTAYRAWGWGEASNDRGPRARHPHGPAAVARLGRRSRGVDALLAAAGVREGAFLGAWNPLSRARPRAWNDAMLARLRGFVRRAGLRFTEGVGHAEKPAWEERHLLLFGDARRAIVLARRFRQHAILRVRLRAASRLLVLR